MNNELTTRVERLESQLRRWRVLTIVVLIAMTVLVVGAAAPPQDNGFIQPFPASRLSAQTFLLVGKDGKTYARLSAKGTQPVLEFYDSNGAVTWSVPSGHNGFKPILAQ